MSKVGIRRVLAPVKTSAIRLSKVLSRKGLYPFLEHNFAQIPQGAKVLNVGAGGQIGEILRQHSAAQNFIVHSVDIDECRSPDIVADICEHSPAHSAYDVVVISEVLEHLWNPHAGVANLRSALVPGGRLILTVPFMFPIHDRPYDYFRYTRYGVEILLKNFTEVTVKERNNWCEAILVLVVRLVMERSTACRLLSPLFVCLALALSPFAIVLGKLLKTDFFTTGYVVTAVKPLEATG